MYCFPSPNSFQLDHNRHSCASVRIAVGRPRSRLRFQLARSGIGRKLPDYPRPRLDQQFAKKSSMARGFVGAIASNREIRLRRQARQQRDEMGTGAHFLAVLACEPLPANLRQWLRCRPRDKVGARRKFRNPNVVIIPLGEFRSRYAARRTPDGAKTQPFARMARRPEADNTNAQCCCSMLNAQCRNGSIISPT